ncbi:MAG: DNA gyrase subunit A [Eubacteriales bacterium]|nr:DNA gyrase subunit A [Eubacteriales bacterium]
MSEEDNKKTNPESSSEENKEEKDENEESSVDENTGAEDSTDESELSDKEVAEKKGEGIKGLQEGIVAGISPDEFGAEIKNSFLDYAVSTLTSRAIPDARDGMKPVQRRIIYDMWEMGVTPDKPFKKSARVVGDVMGKYHPHGDSSIYLAMCRMAQDFAMRYTLVQGHGNFGSPDGDEPAASRYTEARLSKIALEMTRDIEKDTVPFMDTYDADGKEPTVLPSRFPNLLCNESSGIAVGMATSIPPHNLTETIDGVIATIKNPDITVDELMQIIKGPDFPNGGIVLGRSGIRNYFTTGRGSVKVRAKYHTEEKDGHTEIVFTELPYMVNKRDLAKKIVDLSDNKTIDGIASVADYSSQKMGTHFTVVLKKGASEALVLNHLFHYTPLQSNFPVNMLALDNGTPKVLSMKQALKIYIDHQEVIITRRTQYDLKKAQARIHILDAILTVADAIDETVHIIRSSKTYEEAQSRLIDRFHFDEVQCKAILDMPLRRLTGLEQDKYAQEKAGLEEDCKQYNLILSDQSVLESTLIGELEDIKKRFGDARRTEITDYDIDEDDEDLIPNKEILIFLTEGGYVKRVDPSEFRTQNRGGIGVQGMKTKADDDIKILRHSRTKTDVLFFTNLGRVYHCRGYQIPEGNRTSKGIPIVNLLKLMDGEKVEAIISMDDYGENNYLFFATRDGIVKRSLASDFENINSNGKIAITLKEGDELFDVRHTDGKAIISLGSSEGKVCSFYETDVRCMGRTATGVKGIELSEGCHVVGLVTSLDGNKIFSLSENGYGKITDGTEYRITARGSKGVRTIRETEKNGGLFVIKNVKGDEDIILITDHGTTIRTSLTQIKETGRNTVGVKVITLRSNEKISSVSVLPSDSELEAELPETEESKDESNNVDNDPALKELLKRAQEDGDEDSGDDSSDEE